MAVSEPLRDLSFRPLCRLAVCWCGGMLWAELCGGDWRIYLALTAFAALASFVLLSRRPRPAVICLLTAFFFAGGLTRQADLASRPPDAIGNLFADGRLVAGEPVEIEGLVERRPELSPEGFSFVLRAERLRRREEMLSASGRIALSVFAREETVRREYEALELRRGTRIRLAVNLRRGERYLNPGGNSFVEWLGMRDLEAEATLKSPLLVERLGDGFVLPTLRLAEDLRAGLTGRAAALFAPETAGIFIASALGNRRYLTAETAGVFRAGGTFHVLVISGLHITFVGGILLLFVGRLTRRRRWRFGLTVLAVWLYSFAVGAEVPVLRAASMFTILLLATVVHRRGDPLNALGGCVFLLLLWRPADLFSPSFQLTFASMFGIVAAAFPLIGRLRAVGGWRPSAERPFPPLVPGKLKVFCELLYWSERRWRKVLAENVWDCRLFKSNAAARLERRGLQRPLRYIFEGALVTLLVQAFLLPLLVVYFHRISFAAVFLNLWAGIFLVLQNAAALAALCLQPAGHAAAAPPAFAAELCTRLLVWLPETLVAYEPASVRTPVYTGRLQFIYALYYLPLLSLTAFLNGWDPFRPVRHRRGARAARRFLLILSAVLFAILFGLIALHPFSAPAPDGRLTVDFLDVGQGDAALITFPNGETMLVDGGGRIDHAARNGSEREMFEPDRPGIGERVVSEFLWEKGYDRIDHVLATHADADHLKGLIDVLENFRVGTAMYGREAYEVKDFQRFIEITRRKGVRPVRLRRGDSFGVGGVRIDVLNPPAGGEEPEDGSSNDDSLVLRIVYGGRSFLFTGDIEKGTERELLETYGRLEADVVKVPHHGSRTSSTSGFVAAVGAEYAVIPVGRRSRFFHPHEEVVERWRRAGARVLTTGERGTVTVSTDGLTLEVSTFRK